MTRAPRPARKRVATGPANATVRSRTVRSPRGDSFAAALFMVPPQTRTASVAESTQLKKGGEPPGVSALLVIEVPLSPTRAFATFALSFPLLRSRQMTRNRLIFTLISLGLVAAVVGGYILLPRQYKVGRRLNETIVFWNDQEAFFFLNTFTVGQSSNFVSERLGKTSYGYLLSLLPGRSQFYEYSVTAHRLLPSGELQSLALPPAATTSGSW